MAIQRMGIEDFYTVAQQVGFSRDHQMRVVQIGNPAITTLDDNIYIKTATLPGYQVNNIADVKFMGMGFNIPGSGSFPGSEGWNVTFLCDQAVNIRAKLINWQKEVFNAFPSSGDSVGKYGPVGTGSIVKLILIDVTGTTIRGIDLIGAYPTKIGDISYNMQGQGAPVELAVTLAYQWWNEVNEQNYVTASGGTTISTSVAIGNGSIGGGASGSITL